MATTKTLKPTNVTISIPAFTDQPDQRVNSNCIDKEADAINSVYDSMESMAKTVTFARTAATSHNITVPSNSAHFLIIDTSGSNRFFYARVLSASAGTLTIDEIVKGSDVTVSRSTNTLTITLPASATITVVDIVVRGNACS